MNLALASDYNDNAPQTGWGLRVSLDLAKNGDPIWESKPGGCQER